MRVALAATYVVNSSLDWPDADPADGVYGHPDHIASPRSNTRFYGESGRPIARSAWSTAGTLDQAALLNKSVR